MTIVFATLVGVGLAERCNATAHKRQMTLATASIIGPAPARWPFAAFHSGPPIAITGLYLLPPVVLVGYDLVERRRVHWATWLGFVMMLAILAAFSGGVASPGWLAFIRWVQQA